MSSPLIVKVCSEVGVSGGYTALPLLAICISLKAMSTRRLSRMPDLFFGDLFVIGKEVL